MLIKKEEQEAILVHVEQEKQKILAIADQRDANVPKIISVRKVISEAKSQDVVQAEISEYNGLIAEQKDYVEKMTAIEEALESMTFVDRKSFEPKSIAEPILKSEILRNGRIAGQSSQKGRPGLIETCALQLQAAGRKGFGTPFAAGDGFYAAYSLLVNTGKDALDLDRFYEEVDETGIKSEELRDVVKRTREAKSMFVQEPMAGGVPAGEVGSQYNPTGVFAGNTGSICEYLIDEEVELLPFPDVSYMNLFGRRTINKGSLRFNRQTHRLINAKGVNQSIVTPPVNFLVSKPESQFGFSEAKARVQTYADTQPMSEEFIDDCSGLVDIIENQTEQGIGQVYALETLVGDGIGTAQNPQITGLNALIGLSTLTFRGTGSIPVGQLMNAIADTPDTDTPRDAIERSIIEMSYRGYLVDFFIMSARDHTNMWFEKDVDGRKRWTEGELNLIHGARIRGTLNQPAGTAIGGDSRTVKRLMRQGFRIDYGWINEYFRQDMQMLRVTMRAGLKVGMPSKLIRITGLV